MLPQRDTWFRKYSEYLFFLYQCLHQHSVQQSLHIISICHRKTSKNQNIWLPDRKHSFHVVVVKQHHIYRKRTVWAEWAERRLMSRFITFLQSVAASTASTVPHSVSLFTLFLSYCCAKTLKSPDLPLLVGPPSLLTSLHPSIFPSSQCNLTCLLLAVHGALSRRGTSLHSFPGSRWKRLCWTTRTGLNTHRIHTYLHDTLSGYSIVITVHCF